MFGNFRRFGSVWFGYRFYTQPFCMSTCGGSGSTRPDTNSARESTRPRVNSAGSTGPLIFPITGGVFHKYMMFLDMNNDF